MPDIAETSPAGRWTVAGIGFLGLLLTTGAVTLILRDGAPGDRAVSAIVYGLGIALPIGLGLFRLSRRGTDRFAWLLVGTGLLWSLTTLSESSASVPYSIGRVAVWTVEPALVVLMLAFPFGRLETSHERRLAQAAIGLAATLYLPTALLTEFPEPSPWASCGTSCPANAFMLADEPWVGDLVRPLREVLAVVIYGAVAGLLVHRTRHAGSLMRRVLAPVAAVAAYRAAALLAYFVGRVAGADATFLDIVGWLYLLTLPIVAASFALGLLSQRLFVGDALERVAHELREHSDADGLRRALQAALADPSLRLVYWLRSDGGRWVDEAGWPAGAPERRPGRAVTEVRVDGRRLAAISHDSALDPLVVQAAGAHALTTLENDRLISELQASLDELGRSRARIASVADRARREIERDLHDGAQQRLVALRIKLELVAEKLDEESPESATALRRLEAEVETTIDEVRSFARGIYPPVLAQRGLGEALRVAGRIAPIATQVDAEPIGRQRPEVEATVYFACLEALQNAAKHARGATGVEIRLVNNGGLRFEVQDDGEGFVVPAVTNGSGLTNMRDRVAAVGGDVEVRSSPGRGTTVTGFVPVD
jgi:signal transduction histidine kinase